MRRRDAFLAVCRWPRIPHLQHPNLPDEEEDHISPAPLLEHIAEWGKKHLARGTG